MPIYEYECPACNNYYEEICSITDMPDAIPCRCGEYAVRVILTAPATINSDIWSDTKFTPHYDVQLGAHFNDKEEKQRFLQENGLHQVTGDFSPRKENKSRPPCSKDQASKAESNNEL